MRMLDIGWTELMVIGVVALIVVGPKDLPGLFRKLGQFTARARGMAREFQRAMESAADESGVKDIARDLKESASGKDMGLDEFRDIARGPKSWAKDKVMGGKGARATDAKGAKGVPPHDDAGEAAADEADAEAIAAAPAPRRAKAPTAKPQTTKPQAAKTRAAKPQTAKAPETSPKTAKPATKAVAKTTGAGGAQRRAAPKPASKRGAAKSGAGASRPARNTAGGSGAAGDE